MYIVCLLSKNKNFINSHLPWLKYFLLITLKSDLCSKDSCICHRKLLIKRAGFTVRANLPSPIHIMETARQSPMLVHDVASESAVHNPQHEDA